MFVLLESKSEIAIAQRTLESTLQRALPRKAVKDIGYPGGRVHSAHVHTDGRFWFWSRDFRGRKVANLRRLNWFGRFSETAGLGITVEINTPYEGRNDQAAGFFARDTDTGIIYLIHSGRVGGGKKGVGKNAFYVWSNEPVVAVVDSKGLPRRGILVMPIKGSAVAASASRYIDLVARFKSAVRAGETETIEFRRKRSEFEDYYSEARGRRKGRRSSVIDYVSRHGEIVDALHAWRKSRGMPKNARLVKNVFIDLGMTFGKRLIEVFEVKPSANRQSIYTALGQLMVHGNTKNCRMTLVIPKGDTLPKGAREALVRLKVQVVCFRLDKNSVKIIDT